MGPKKPSVKMIDKVLGRWLAHEGITAKQVREALDEALDSRWRSIDEAMLRANSVLNGHGVEAIRGDSPYEPAALYVNMGDTYTATILYDRDANTFHVTSYGDWIESQERRGRRFE